MHYKLVQRIDDDWIVTEADNPLDMIDRMEARGYPYRGIHDNPRTRDELQGQPEFTGLLGPMYDGDAIRYENPEAYHALSA